MLILTFEGFSPVALSCYGSSWNRSESIDEIAANGTTWDRVITNTTNPVDQVARWMRENEFNAEQCTLLTDDERLADLGEISRIGELIVVPPSHNGVAETVEQTNLAMLASVVAEQIASDENVWMHSRFLTRCWDSPRELFPIEHFDDVDFGPLDPSESIEEEMRELDRHDETPPSTVPPILDEWRPPEINLSAGDDPDWIMTWMRTYACQVRLIDAVVGLLAEIAAEHDRGTLTIAGASGFALGQNGAIGHRVGRLRSCQLHVPCISTQLRIPGQPVSFAGVGIGVRHRYVTAADTVPRFWAGNSARNPTATAESWARNETPEPVITLDDEKPVAITEQEWFYVEDSVLEQPEAAPGKLFLKPDDLSDINDVTRLRPDVVERLSETLEGRSPT